MKSYDLALDEIRHLNLKRQELESQVQKLSREIEAKSVRLNEIVADIEFMSQRVKQLRNDEVSLSRSISDSKAKLQVERESLNATYDEVTKIGIANAKKLQEIKTASDALNEKMTEIKTRESKLEQRMDRIHSELEKLTASSADLKNREYMLTKREVDLDERNKALTNRIMLSNVQIEKDRTQVASDLEMVRVKRKDLDEKIMLYTANSEEAEREKNKAQHLFNEYTSAVKEIDAMRIGIMKEKQEIEIQKKKVEIERLRVEKLAHDKGVEEELQKLRAERGVK